MEALKQIAKICVYNCKLALVTALFICIIVTSTNIFTVTSDHPFMWVRSMVTVDGCVRLALNMLLLIIAATDVGIAVIP